jgi:N-acetyl-anhydromuramyl-L-alanine amidase AmpD
MSYRYVQARYDSYGNRTATKALVVHMTEGSGTEADVDYLANNPLRGVSVHFVILKTGEIVQMLGWGRIAGSINPNELRTTDDPPYTSPDGARVVYGATLRDAIMGSWINGGLLAVEVGGKAVDGPNQAQSEALVRLVTDVRTRYPGLPVLGHRDFTSTKGCPGHKVLWASLGGHGKPVAPPKAPEDTVEAKPVYEAPYVLPLASGTWLYWYSDLRATAATSS